MHAAGCSRAPTQRHDGVRRPTGEGHSSPEKWVRYTPKSCILTCLIVSAMYLICNTTAIHPLYLRHSDDLYRCVSCMYRQCIVMYRSCAWCPRLCYYIDTCGGIDFLQYWTIQCRIQVSYMYQMYRESLGGISVVYQLALMSARCLGRQDLPTLLAYYPYYCILPLPPSTDPY